MATPDEVFVETALKYGATIAEATADGWRALFPYPLAPDMTEGFNAINALVMWPTRSSSWVGTETHLRFFAQTSEQRARCLPRPMLDVGRWQMKDLVVDRD